MKATEESLRNYLKQLNVKEKGFLLKMGMELSTIAAAIHFAITKPESGDWLLIYKIKSLCKDFEIEHFKIESKRPAKKTPAVPPKDMDMTKHSLAFEDYFKKHVGARLKALRKTRGYTAADMSLVMGTEPNNWSSIETGRTHLSCYRLYLTCKKMNVSYQSLVNLDGNDKDPKSLELLLIQKEELIHELQAENQRLKESESKYKLMVDDILSKIKNA